MKLIFNKYYFLIALTLLLLEVGIAVFISDRFVRPFLGDVLVVILLYCFLKTFLNASVLRLALLVLLFASMVETLQYFNFVDLLGLQHHNMLAVTLGRTFDWMDLLAYAIGVGLVLLVEKIRAKREKLQKGSS